jgi:predicted nucleic acid-binding protein
MSVVVDTSVLVAALIDSSERGAWAEDVLISGSLHAPELARVEATNILRRLERAKNISSAEANSAQDDLMQLNLASRCREDIGTPGLREPRRVNASLYFLDPNNASSSARALSAADGSAGASACLALPNSESSSACALDAAFVLVVE